MGMAVGDFDRDSDLDLFITGFANEYNIFYRQEFAGFWIDHTDAVVTFELPLPQSPSGEPQTGTRKLYRIAGNGYLCSNEAVLQIGLVHATEIRQVVIDWPNGRTQKLSNLDVGQRYMVIEGSNAMQTWWRQRHSAP